MKVLIRTLAGVVTRAPWLVLVGVLVLTGAFAWLASGLESATGQEGFSPSSEEIDAAERVSELFGAESTTSIVQVVVRDEGGDVLTAEGLRVVDELTAAIVASDAGAFVADRADSPGLVSYLAPVQAAVGALGLDPATLDDEAVKALYLDALAEGGPELGFSSQLVPDGSGSAPELGMVLVFVEATTDLEEQIDREVAVADAVAEVAEGTPYEVAAFSFALLFGGDDDFLEEVGQLFATAFAVIIGVLLFVYWVLPAGRFGWVRSLRRMLADTSVTMLTIVLVVLWMNGIGALLQRTGVLGPLTEVAQIVPILLVGLGVDYGIHLTSRYRDEIGRGAGVDQGMRTAIGTVGVALVLATLTTAVGFLSNLVNPIPALADFGVLASVGILAAFVLMLTFVPALRIVLDRRAEAGDRLPVEGLGRTRDRLLPELAGRTAVLAERAPVATVVVAAALGGLGYVGLMSIDTEFSFTDFLPEDSPVVQTLVLIQDEFGGGFGETTQVLIEDVDLSDPAAFNAVTDLVDAAAGVDGVLTVPTPVGDVASARAPAAMLQQLAFPGPGGAAPEAFLAAATAGGFDLMTGRMADDADVVSVLEAARELDADRTGSVVAWDDAGRPHAALVELDTQAGESGAIVLRDALVDELGPLTDLGAATVVTSANIITSTIVDSLSDSQVRSLVLTLLVAMLVLVVSFGIENRRPLLGVITMVPVALVVLWTFGLMYLSGIPFGPVTATLTGLAVGIGVPYTIHMARRFEEDRTTYASLEQAIRETTRNTGGALVGSALTTAGGFGVLITSSLVPFQQMGQVTAYAILLALVGAVLVLPSLLVLWERWHRRRGQPVVERETVSVV